METTTSKILNTARQQSVFRAVDVKGSIDPRSTLRRMVRCGDLVQVRRGLYALPTGEITEHHTLVEASQAYPGSVICLISALVFHGIGTQMPHVTWLMRHDRRRPLEQESHIRFVYCSTKTFSFGIEHHILEGLPLKIYSPARTVADCFKYRNKLGLDIALEALKEGWRAGRFTMDELWAASNVCRVQRVIQPYLEMLSL